MTSEAITLAMLGCVGLIGVIVCTFTLGYRYGKMIALVEVLREMDRLEKCGDDDEQLLEIK